MTAPLAIIAKLTTHLLIWRSRRRVARAKRLFSIGDAIMEGEIAYWEKRLGRRI